MLLKMKLLNVVGTESFPTDIMSTVKYLADITELVEGSANRTTVKLSADIKSSIKLLAVITNLVKCSVNIINSSEN